MFGCSTASSRSRRYNYKKSGQPFFGTVCNLSDKMAKKCVTSFIDFRVSYLLECDVVFVEAVDVDIHGSLGLKIKNMYV